MTASNDTRIGTPENDPIIEVRNASVTFDMDRGESRVLDSVSMDIRRDEILGIVGESGSGKSMFASALLNAVVEPGVLSGEITYSPADGDPIRITDLEGDDLRNLRWEAVSMVFQGAMSSFNPTLTIKGHFKETLLAHDYPLEEGFKRAFDLLSDLYLEPERVMESYPHELSGGMQQRALIALSLVLEPDVLVMDEPTAALDLLMQRSILELLEDLQEKYDLTLVFITHDLPLVAELCDRLAVMYAFEFVEIGPSDEILENGAHPYTRSLLKATPNLESPLETMQPVEGSSPDPVNVPEGCSYHPRCPLATEECTVESPGYHEVDADHRAACFHWEDSAEAIPLEQETEGSDRPVEPREGARTDSTDVVVSMDEVEVHFEQSSSAVLSLFGDDRDTVRAVDGVSIDIHENDVVTLVGESGCGKTTLGKTAIGLQRPTGGSVKYNGQDVWEAKDGRGDGDISFGEIRRSLQIIHQDPGSALNPYRKIGSILAEPLRKQDLGQQDREARILRMLETVGMTPPSDYAERYPHQLSGGEKQRVALIRALLMNPDLILADEAISALDVSLRIEMMDLFLDLQDQFDTSFVFISHDLSNARYLTEKAGGRIGIMYLGELVEVGSAEQIINNPQHPYTKVLRWATPNLDVDEEVADMPMRKIDIPDPVDPPSGCRFHTRCPVAREVCAEQTPELESVEGSGGQAVACFRADPSHEYWDSPELGEEGELPDVGDGEGSVAGD